MFKQEIYEDRMAVSKMNDGVGKKIVDALKMQTPDSAEVNDIESQYEDSSVLQDSSASILSESGLSNDDIASSVEQEDDHDVENSAPYQEVPQIPSDIQLKIQAQLREQAAQSQFQQITQPQMGQQSFVDTAFQQSLAQNLGSAYTSVQDDFDYPANVAVLKQLIGKLPAGVSKQTGAIIIKQTMEALGISMKSVIQEAQQVQQTLTNNTKECQASIVEYRKQIGILEAKSQQYQRQYAVMNDIISLFIQTGSNNY